MLVVFRKTILLLLLTLLAVVRVDSAEQQFNCPNNGTPRVDESGKPIQCLPGQLSEQVCGKGYSCYFSGFNYQCCPTNDDEKEVRHIHSHDEYEPHHSNENQHQSHEEESIDSNAECPDETFMVLDARGSPIQCNPTNNPCTGKSMFCNKFSSKPVCCESVNTNSYKSEHQQSEQPLSGSIQQQSSFSKPIQKKQKLKAKKVGSRRSIVNRDMSLNGECSDNSVVVLSEVGQPISCDRNHKCPLDSLLCLKSNNGKSYCCQIVPKAIEKVAASSPLKYLPSESKQIIEELKAEEKQKNIRQQQPLQPPSKTILVDNQFDLKVATEAGPPSARPRNEGKSSSTFETKNEKVNIADNETQKLIDSDNNENNDQSGHNQSGSLGILKNFHAVAHSVKTHTETKDDTKTPLTSASASDPLVEYKPHSQGGYAVLKKLELVNGPQTDEKHKLAAQRYLLDQIKNGWPYDERYYRSENVVTINKGSHPAAIVHFPN